MLEKMPWLSGFKAERTRTAPMDREPDPWDQLGMSWLRRYSPGRQGALRAHHLNGPSPWGGGGQGGGGSRVPQHRFLKMIVITACYKTFSGAFGAKFGAKCGPDLLNILATPRGGGGVGGVG